MTAAEQRFADLAMKAGEVFTPTAPVDERRLFAGRTEEIRLIVDVINQKGQHAVLYGERGVGKTSLANVVSTFLAGHPTGRVLAPRVNCDSTDTYATVWAKAFERMDGEITLTRPARQAGIFSATGTQTTVDVSPTELLGDPIAPDSVRRALTGLAQSNLPIIIIDEFDRLSAEPRRAFADTVKMLSDYAVPVTLLLVGVADSVEQLIEEHHSVERALNQIRMPRMPAVEIYEILELGLKELGMTIDPTARRRVGKLTQGLPHYAHLLALHACRTALDAQRLAVEPGDVSAAIEKAITGSQQSIQSDYEFAVRSSKKDSLFSDVLLACALAETTELGHFAAQDVRDPLRRITKKNYEITSFAQHLTEFCDQAKRRGILQKTGVRRLYRYRFANPLMQPHVIMRGLKAKRIEHEMLD